MSRPNSRDCNICISTDASRLLWRSQAKSSVNFILAPRIIYIPCKWMCSYVTSLVLYVLAYLVKELFPSHSCQPMINIMLKYAWNIKYVIYRCWYYTFWNVMCIGCVHLKLRKKYVICYYTLRNMSTDLKPSVLIYRCHSKCGIPNLLFSMLFQYFFHCFTFLLITIHLLRTFMFLNVWRLRIKYNSYLNSLSHVDINTSC